jgi:enoyl-CoA hydratase
MRLMITITMDGPGKNALGTETMKSLLAQIEGAKGAAILLTGSGDAFSAGLNLKEVGSLDAPGMDRFLRLLEQCMTALYLHPAPTVALVNGHAIAGGCVLTLCCDHRIAIDRAKIKIGLNEVALGVRFPPRVMAIVRARVPSRHVHDVVLGAGLFDPAGALRNGLIDEIVPDDAEAIAHARRRLSALAMHPAHAYAHAKEDLRGTASTMCPDAAWERAIAEAVPTWTSASVREKIASVLER